MANTLLTIGMITQETLAVIKNTLGFTRNVNRQYDDRFAVSGAKIGDTINVRKPARYVGRVGQAVSIEDITETSIPVVLTTQRGVDLTFSTSDMALKIDQFSSRIIRPAVANIVNAIDFEGLTLAKNATYNQTGTPGTTPASIDPYLDAGVLLDNMGTPRDGQRTVIMNPRANATLTSSLKGIFNNQGTVSAQNKSGMMTEAYGFDWGMDQNVNVQTTGPLGGTPLVVGASQTGSTLLTDGWTAAAALRLNKGDVFTVAGVFSVNPQSRQTTGVLQQFVATANVSSDGTGAASIPISPPIITSGAFQNVTVSPADNAALTISGAANVVSPQNIAYHKDAFTLACADLPLVGGTDICDRRSDPDSGLSIRLVRQYVATTDQLITRLDILYGWAPLYPEWACRIAG